MKKPKYTVRETGSRKVIFEGSDLAEARRQREAAWDANLFGAAVYENGKRMPPEDARESGLRNAAMRIRQLEAVERKYRRMQER